MLFEKFTFSDIPLAWEEVGGAEDEDANHQFDCASCVLLWVEQANAQETSSLTVSRDPDPALSADNVGKILAGASKLWRKVSARTNNPNTVAYRVTFKRNGLVTTFASLAPAARSRTGRGGEKLSPFPVLRQPGTCAFA